MSAITGAPGMVDWARLLGLPFRMVVADSACGGNGELAEAPTNGHPASER